jgi:hypothetical protein
MQSKKEEIFAHFLILRLHMLVVTINLDLPQ